MAQNNLSHVNDKTTLLSDVKEITKNVKKKLNEAIESLAPTKRIQIKNGAIDIKELREKQN